jgi:hypothetical protein
MVILNEELVVRRDFGHFDEARVDVACSFRYRTGT